MFEKLSAPFAPDAIHWRAQTLTKNKEKALALAYLDARDVMDRFDEAVGPANWQDSYVETVKGRVICTIAVRVGEEWVSKSDGAGDTAVEGDKGGISDAFKRAAVKWGVGRYLYDLGTVWAPCELYNDKWTAWKPEAKKLFTAALLGVAKGVAPTPERVSTLNDDQRFEVIALLEATGVPASDYLAVGNWSDLREVPQDQFELGKKWINKQAAKRAAEQRENA
jgi:hypothetical protein